MVTARDGLDDTVFQGWAVHTPVEEQHTETSAIKQVEAESVDSSSAEAENAEDEMVVQRNMTADQFFLGGRPAAQQQQPQDKE